MCLPKGWLSKLELLPWVRSLCLYTPSLSIGNSRQLDGIVSKLMWDNTLLPNCNSQLEIHETPFPFMSLHSKTVLDGMGLLDEHALVDDDSLEFWADHIANMVGSNLFNEIVQEVSKEEGDLLTNFFGIFVSPLSTDLVDVSHGNSEH